MKKSFSVLTIFLCSLLLNACASKTIPGPNWLYQKDALEITFQADRDLNWYNDQSHTLQLCIYQLKDPNGFNQHIESEDGLYKLLECGMFDGSVANYRNLTMFPGKTQSVVLDRAEGAKYIGIAAGYADIQKDRITRLIEIPVIVVTEGGMFSRRKVAKPDRLDITLRLGPHQIEAVMGE